MQGLMRRHGCNNVVVDLVYVMLSYVLVMLIDIAHVGMVHVLICMHFVCTASI
jgi:hypothetical protein